MIEIKKDKITLSVSTKDNNGEIELMIEDYNSDNVAYIFLTKDEIKKLIDHLNE